MMDFLENTRAVVGDNNAQAAADRVTAYLQDEYKARTAEIDALLEEARGAPTEVPSDEVATSIGSIVKRLRTLDKTMEAYREAEKAPHKLSADAVDAFFFRHRERLARRNPKDRSQKPGAADILQARIDDFLDRKAIEEENRRKEEARKAREAQAEADRLAREAMQKAEEARLAAERARSKTFEKTAVAVAAQDMAKEAAVDAELAAQAAREAMAATQAKPAELSRTRGEGVLLTQKKEPYANLEDRNLLDKAALWPFFTDAEIEKALRAWARSTGHKQEMAGADVGIGRKGVTR